MTSAQKQDFLARLRSGPVLIADGAMGTMLQKAGLRVGEASERWNIENPDAVRKIHEAYVDAGAQVLLTNTFGGTPLRLMAKGLADRLVEVNRNAVTIARLAAGERAFVVGDIGPTGQLLHPLGTLSVQAATEAFAAQAMALAEGGADALLIETMSDLEEAKAAVQGVRSVTQLPLLVTMSFDTKGRTMMGVRPQTAAHELWDLGVEAIGANCGRTLEESLQAIVLMRAAVPDAVLMAKPNAGLPQIHDRNVVYEVDPQVMGEYAVRFADLGVRIIGGCCGSTPDHIRGIAQALHRAP